MAKCRRCGTNLEYCGKGRPRTYCEDCAYVRHLEYMRGYMMRRRGLGTSDFYQHPCSTFEAEISACEREIRRIGFRKQFT